MKNISKPWLTVQYEEFKFVLCFDVMLNITMKHHLKTVISYATHYSCWKMSFSSVVHCAVMVFAIYLTLLSITKKIIKYTSTIHFCNELWDHCTCHLKHISSQTSSKYKKQELYYQTFLWVAFMATVFVCIYKQNNTNNNCITISWYNSNDTDCSKILVYMNLFPN